MATPKIIVSEIFYHKVSAIRFDLSSYRDQTRFKIEVIPQAKDEKGNPVEKRFDYKNSISMIFGMGEILRFKRFVENVINPQKKTGEEPGDVPANGYTIEHYFEVKDAQQNTEKKKSTLTVKRVENKYKDPKHTSPYGFKYAAICTMYSSFKNTSLSIALTEEEAYWVINEMPFFAWAYMAETGRINNENRVIAAGTSNKSSLPAKETPQPKGDYEVAGDAFEGMEASKTPPDAGEDNIDLSFVDINL